MKYECGGCEGMGTHKRWCREWVGPRAALLGTAAEQAEDLADQVGANHMASANALYGVSSMLRKEALSSKEEWQAHEREQVEG